MLARSFTLVASLVLPFIALAAATPLAPTTTLIASPPAIQLGPIEPTQVYRQLEARSAPAVASPEVSGSRRKRSARMPIPTTLPLGSIDLARCTPGMMACPTSPMTLEEAFSAGADADYECISPEEELYSCGGCTTLGTGEDCTAIPNVLSVECSMSTCNVLRCQAGYVKAADGRSCVLAPKPVASRLSPFEILSAIFRRS